MTTGRTILTLLCSLAMLLPASAEVPAWSFVLGSNGMVEVTCRGNPGAPYQLERTSGLESAWEPMGEQMSSVPELYWSDDAPYPDGGFYRVVETAAPFTATQFAAAADYSRIAGGAAVLVMQHGEIVFEDYHNGADTNTATYIHSGTKAFWACALAAAIEDGLITGYDEVVADTITEWQDITLHPGKRLITVEDLVALSSGLSQDIDYIQGHDPLADDIYDYVVNSLRITSIPGNKFQYGPSHYYAFGVLLQRKLAQAGTPMNPLEYLQARVLTPLGIEYTNWVHDDAGNPHIPNGCELTPRNWVKLGQFFLQQGWWNNCAVLPSGEMAVLRSAAGPNPGHGKFLWLNQPGGSAPGVTPPPGSPGGFMYPSGYPDILGGLGAGKNRMYIVPSRNAIIVRQTVGDTGTFEDDAFLATLLAD